MIQRRSERHPDIQLFFDAMGIEGHFEKAHPGYLPGDLDLLAWLLTKEILYPSVDTVNLDRAIRADLLVRRAVLIAGAKISEGSLNLEALPSELDKVYGSKPSAEFTPVTIDYSLIQTVVEAKRAKDCTYDQLVILRLDQMGPDIRWPGRSRLTGPMKALQGWNIPIAKYNNLLTVDRKEIEFLHHLKTLIAEYLQNKI